MKHLSPIRKKSRTYQPTIISVNDSSGGQIIVRIIQRDSTLHIHYKRKTAKNFSPLRLFKGGSLENLIYLDKRKK